MTGEEEPPPWEEEEADDDRSVLWDFPFFPALLRFESFELLRLNTLESGSMSLVSTLGAVEEEEEDDGAAVIVEVEQLLLVL